MCWFDIVVGGCGGDVWEMGDNKVKTSRARAAFRV